MARLTRSFPPGSLAASPAPAAVPGTAAMAASALFVRRIALAAAALLAMVAAYLAGNDAVSARAEAAIPN